jgi:hypothetical protein
MSPVSSVLSPPRLRAALTARGRRLRRRTILEHDLWVFRRRYGDVVGGVTDRSEGVALIASLTESVFQLKLEGVLAKAFQSERLEPVAAVPAGADLARRYLEVFGIRRFVTLDDYLTPDLEAAAEDEAAAAVERVADQADVKALVFRGAGVGRQALSTVSRYLHEGHVDLSEPETRGLLRRFLALANRTALAAGALLDDVRPDAVLFCERNYAAEGPLCDLALERGLNTIQFVSGFEDDALVFKRYTAETKGLHPRSLSDESWPLVEGMAWTPEHDAEVDDEFARRYEATSFLVRLNQPWTKPASRADLAERLGLDPGRPTAVVFSHLLWDANMFYGRDLFADQEEWFVETVRAAAENDRANWVVKLHPANVWKNKRDGFQGELDELVAMRERIGRLPDHVRVLPPDTDISTWSLFAVTDVGVTIRGSVGFELPCLGVPVLTAGTGFYSGRGITVDSSTPEEYLGRLRSVETIPPPTPEQVTLARKHAYALFRLRQTRFTSFRARYRPIEEIDHPFEATIEIHPRTRAELAAADDLRRLGEWAVRSRALDYLEEPPA